MTDPVLVPDVEAALLRVSQALFEDTVQLKVPLPLLLIESVWALGAAPFWIDENEKDDGVRLIVGDVVTGGVVGSSAAVICAVPGISENRRLILAGRLFALPPDVAAAVFVVGDAAPINAVEGAGGGVGAAWPVSVSGRGVGTRTDSGEVALAAPPSFDREEEFSAVGAESWPVDGLSPGIEITSVDGLEVTEAVLSGLERRISL